MPLTRSSQSATAAHSSICRVCGKSIHNEASVKRHERYCRKRLTYPAPPRQKSCIACIRAKSRCDLYTPACGPCQRKGRSCIYSSESLASREERLILSPTRSSHEQRFPDAPIAVPIARREPSQNNSLHVGMFSTFETPSWVVRSEVSNTLPSEPRGVSATEYKKVTNDPLKNSNLPSTSKSLETPYTLSSRLLRHRERQPARTKLVSNLISQILCSYTERRMNKDSYPPFIHHSAFQRSAKPIIPEDPIIVCQDITRGFVERKSRSDRCVWDAIASEQERIYDQRGSFSRWLHLSSAQAITIYLLMLVAEGPSVLSHHPNLLITLLFTLGSLFEQLNQIHPGFMAAKEESQDRPTREDWIFAESKLRTATVYFIVALHFDLDFGLPCNRESDYKFEDVNLPAGKILWEAKTELSWRKEFDLMEQARNDLVPVRTSEERLKYADLVKLNKQHCGHELPDIQDDKTRLAERIAKWQKEMDEFGMLVALCSTML